MAQIIGLPKLSPTMEEGVLVRWTKKEGDKVSPGDLVAEVETDKANMDFNIEDDGVLLKLLVKEGDTVKLGAPVAILGKAGEVRADPLIGPVITGEGRPVMTGDADRRLRRFGRCALAPSVSDSRRTAAGSGEDPTRQP